MNDFVPPLFTSRICSRASWIVCCACHASESGRFKGVLVRVRRLQSGKPDLAIEAILVTERPANLRYSWTDGKWNATPPSK